MTINKCGSCSLCCKVMDIPVLDKVDGQWCRHFCKGKGCGIYEERPQVCQDFLCLWRSGFGPEGESGPDDMRPDRCHVVFAPGMGSDTVVGAYCDPAYPDAWKAEKVMFAITRIALAGFKVLVSTKSGSREKILFRHSGMQNGQPVIYKQTITLDEPDENGIMWYRSGGKEALNA